jgi:hypothetical protein
MKLSQRTIRDQRDAYQLTEALRRASELAAAMRERKAAVAGAPDALTAIVYMCDQFAETLEGNLYAVWVLDRGRLL